MTNEKLTLSERLKLFFRGEIPLSKSTRIISNPISQPSYIASSMSVDKLHSILRSAEQGDCADLFSLYRDILASDSHLQSEFAKRKMVLICEIIQAQPADENNLYDVSAAEFVQNMLDSIPQRTRILSHMLDACLYPLSVVEKVFRKSNKQSLCYELDRLVEVPHRLLDLRSGDVRIFKIDDFGNTTTESFLANPESFIIHRGHILTSPDYWGGPMRSLLFWWLFSTMDIGWWAEWLERFGTPFLIGKYDQSDTTSRGVLTRAFSAVQRLGGLVITKDTEVEINNALSSQNGDSFEKFIAICNREKSKLVLGQTLSAEAQPTGLGSGVADSHEAVRRDIKLFDAMMLATTIRDELVIPFMRYNNIRGEVPKIIIGGEDEKDLTALSNFLTAITTSGLQLSDDAIGIISQRSGLTLERREAFTQMSGQNFETFSSKIPAQKSDMQAVWDIASATSSDIAQHYGKASAVIEDILKNSKSPQDFEDKIKTFCATWPSEEVTMLIQDALNTNLINGANS